jgi:hypothetical protein
MATLDDLRRLALALPGAHEITHTQDFGAAPWFNVGKKTFALAPTSPEAAGRAVLKLDRAHQDLLFEARPDVFQPCKVATVHWAYVDLGKLEAAELETLVREAWSQVAPKKVSRGINVL